MEKYGKIFLNRPYILKDFNSRLIKLQKRIKRELNVIERIRLIEKTINEDDRRIARQKSSKSIWVTISKPKIELDSDYAEFNDKDIKAIKEIEKADHESMMSQIGWDRS